MVPWADETRIADVIREGRATTVLAVLQCGAATTLRRHDTHRRHKVEFVTVEEEAGAVWR